MSRQEAAPEDRPAAAWRQCGGFSVFFEVRADAATGETWQTRIYHEETGQEIVVAGLGETEWPEWVLGRIDGRDRPVPPGPAVHHLTVEVVDVRLVGRTADDDAEVVRVEAELRVHGLAALERGLGAAVLDRGMAPRRAT